MDAHCGAPVCTQGGRASTSTATVIPAASSAAHNNHNNKYEPQFSRNVDIHVMKMMHSRPGGVGVYLKKDLVLMVRSPFGVFSYRPAYAYSLDVQPHLLSHLTLSILSPSKLIRQNAL